MLVSVVTPCLNPGARLARCLESVAAQTHPDVEHVVVDGGSTDGTVELLGRSGVRYLSEPDDGQTDAIAKGFGVARGELLTWLNADDELEPHAVARAASTGAEWVYGDCTVIDGGRRTVWRPLPRYGRWEVEAGEMIPQPGSFFSRAALERAGGLDPSFELAMDVDLWIRLVDAGIEGRYVPEVMAVFEIHPGSKTGSVGRGGFLLEHAQALAKSGRYRAASAALGRASVFGGRPDLPDWADPRVVRAATAAESAIEQLRARNLRGALRLVRPSIWREREVRTRLIAGLRREVRPG
jgi:glycosyltransferase involved in cell wall biosynthesis